MLVSGGIRKSVSSGELVGGSSNPNASEYSHNRRQQQQADSRQLVVSSSTLPRSSLAPLVIENSSGDVNRNTLSSRLQQDESSTRTMPHQPAMNSHEDDMARHHGKVVGGKKSFWVTLRDKLSLARGSNSYNSYDLGSGIGAIEIPGAVSSSAPTASTVTSKDSGISSELGDSIPSTPVSLVDEKIPGICGMHNLGNTCYMNAVLQCLSHVDTVVEYFALEEYKDELKQLKKKSKKLESKGEITERLAMLMKSLWSDGYSKELCQEFKDTVEKYGQQYGGSEQHDAQEFFLWLLDIVHQELSKSQKQGKKKQVATVKKKKNVSDEVLAAVTLAAHTQHSQSFIQDLFQAQYRSSLTCPNCGRQSSTFDPFMTISLPIPQQHTLPIYVTVVFQSLEKKPMRLGLSMDMNTLARDLLAKVATTAQLPSDALLLAKVSDDGHQCVFRETDSLLQVSEAEHSLYVFEVPDIAYVNSTQKANPNGMAPTTEFTRVSGRQSSMNQTGDSRRQQDEATMPSNTIILIVTNVEVQDRRCYRFGYPVVIRVSRELKFRDLQILIRRELPVSIRDEINRLARSSRLSFGMRIVEGIPGRDYLSNDADCPLYQPSVDRALMCCREDKHAYVSVVAEWEAGHSKSLARFGVSSPVEHASVKRVRDQYKESFTVDLHNCIELHTKDEELQCDDAWVCSNCKQEQRGTIKKLSLWSLPDVLVFHLKRFQQANQWKGKISTLIDFPLESLDLTKHVSRRQQSGSSPRLLRRSSAKKHRPRSQSTANAFDCVYDLFAVCDHIGPYMTNGHYTACCKNSADGNWYSFDDAVVKQVSEAEVVRKSAYMLFYQRRTVMTRSNSLTSISTTSSSNHWAQRISRINTPEKTRKEMHF